MGIVSFLLSMFLVEVLFFTVREYFLWDSFVVRSPAIASLIATARGAATVFLLFKVFKSFEYMRPALAAAGALICATIILMPVSIFTSILPRGRLSALFSYSTRVMATVIGVPLIWHVVFVEAVINPVAGPVFIDSTPSSVMMCFWFAGSIVGLTLHTSMDKQVRHMAPQINQQGLLFSLEALKFTMVYTIIQFLVSSVVVAVLNFSEIIVGEFGDFSLSVVIRMFFATAFCTFLTWIGAQYLSACLDPHPSCSLSISDARSLAGGFKTSLYSGHVAYRCLHTTFFSTFMTLALTGRTIAFASSQLLCCDGAVALPTELLNAHSKHPKFSMQGIQSKTASLWMLFAVPSTDTARICRTSRFPYLLLPSSSFSRVIDNCIGAVRNVYF